MILVLRFLILFLMLFFFEKSRAGDLLIKVGETLNLPFKGKTLWVENSKVLKVKVIGKLAHVQGRQEGASLISLDKESFFIQVLHPQTLQKKNEIQTEIEKISGLKGEYQSGYLYIRGSLTKIDDWMSLKKMSELLHIKYIMGASFSKKFQTEAQNYVNSILKNRGLKEQVFLFNDRVEVHIAETENLQNYQAALNDLGIKVLQDSLSIETTPTVRVQIYITEVKKEFARQYGLQPPTSYSAQLVNNTWTGDTLNFNIKALENSGHGRILAHPDLICKSGKEAEFMAGGEFPIKVSNFRMSSVIWKQYGIILKIKPLADPSGKMSLSVHTEISNIDASKTVEGIPGLLTNKVSSEFDLLKPQVIALSGLIKSEEAQSQEGLAWLSKIPILGALFSSQDFRENRSELVIWVYPTILETPANEDLHPPEIFQKTEIEKIHAT